MVHLFGLLLDGRTLTAKAIAKECGIEYAAGARRLQLLRELRGALSTNGREAGVALRGIARREPASPSAVAAVCLASGLATAFERTSLAEPLLHLREDWVGRSKRGYQVDDLRRKFWFVVRGGESALDAGAAKLGEVIEAVLASQQLSFDYRRFEGEREHLAGMQPLTLALHEHQLYVIARAGEGLPHPYRFSRMTNVRRGRRFEYPLDSVYDPRRSFANVFGIFIDQNDSPIERVDLRFAPKWRNYIETHRWHETQWTPGVAGPDGRIEVQLQVRVCHELRRWILGFGTDVEVVGPPALREELAAAVRSAAEQYAPRPGVRRTTPKPERVQRPRRAGLRNSR